MHLRKGLAGADDVCIATLLVVSVPVASTQGEPACHDTVLVGYMDMARSDEWGTGEVR